MSPSKALGAWTEEQIALGRRWARIWQEAGPRLEAIRRQELRAVDAYRAISLLCGPTTYDESPRAAKPTSGLLEQQRLLARLRRA
jgi:hypothetical protein